MFFTPKTYIGGGQGHDPCHYYDVITGRLKIRSLCPIMTPISVKGQSYFALCHFLMTHETCDGTDIDSDSTLLHPQKCTPEINDRDNDADMLQYLVTK
jgi:hypothetical protein